MTRLNKGRTVPFAEKVAPDSTALIVVDVQNDFCHPDGYHAKAGADMSMMPGMARNHHSSSVPHHNQVLKYWT